MSDKARIKRGIGQRRKWVPNPIQYPQKLPISKRHDEIVEAIRRHPVIILSGETGSGKTTQIPKMCLDAGRGRKMRIACTQPRRVAALSIAKRVSEELKIEYGREVGSKIRFSDKTSQETRIKFLTDGMLLAEIQSDPSMSEYDTIIIDEAHERSLNIDFLLGHLNQLRKRRPDLKVIVTSATIDIEKFSNAFDSAPIIEVSGRVYPVEVVYAPLDELLEDSGEFTVIDGVAESIDRIINDFKQGDILVFLPTEKDILETRDLLEGRLGNRFDILPCFGRLSSGDQQRIFAPSKYRKIVLATNIAETSLTIPEIRFVVDTGLARTSRYNPKARTKQLANRKNFPEQRQSTQGPLRARTRWYLHTPVFRIRFRKESRILDPRNTKIESGRGDSPHESGQVRRHRYLSVYRPSLSSSYQVGLRSTSRAGGHR